MDKTLMQYKKTKKDAFEGYYFKHTFEHISINFIVGFSTSNPHSFIQVIESTPMSSKYYTFKLDEMEISNDPFYIKIKNNFFSFEKIIVDLDEYKGKVSYYSLTKLEKFLFFNNIMGPFVMLPNMKCNHAIISMDHEIKVDLTIRDKKYLTTGRGYIEKDYGKTFPENYVWIHSNDFLKEKASLFFSIATIPYMGFTFDGVICNFIYDNKEYRFATYNRAKYYVNDVTDNMFYITLTKGNVKLNIKATTMGHAKLVAPTNGLMIRKIKEGLNGEVEIRLTIDGKEVYSDVSTFGAIELTNQHHFNVTSKY